MARKSILLMTQEIMEEMGSDVVNSIADTEESAQVAAFIRQAFETVMDERQWSWKRKITSLTALGLVGEPTSFDIPDAMSEIIWLKYNNKELTYMDPTDFYELIKGRDTTASNVSGQGFRTDVDPSYWTSYDDSRIVMDAVDISTETTLTQGKQAAYAFMDLDWTHEDAFVPPVPSKFMKYIQDEARSLSFINILKTPSPKVEQSLARSRARAQASGSPVHQLKQVSNPLTYGRKP